MALTMKKGLSVAGAGAPLTGSRMVISWVVYDKKFEQKYYCLHVACGKTE